MVGVPPSSPLSTTPPFITGRGEGGRIATPPFITGRGEVARDNPGEILRLASATGDIAKVQALLRDCVSVNSTDEFGYSALQRAASEGHVEIVKLLIKHKSQVDHQDDQHGNTALHEAAWKGLSQTAEALVRAKANVYIQNKGGFAPLHLACQNSHNQTCRILLLAGCKPDIKNNYGDTPLHTAARYGHAGVSRILISAKANVNQENKNSDTALHIAVAMNRKKLTRILLEAAANQKIRNKQNETAEDISLRKGFHQITESLRNPPEVISHEDQLHQELNVGTKKKKETKGVTFKEFVDEGKNIKGEKTSDKKRDKSNASGTSSKETSSSKTKDKKKTRHDKEKDKSGGRHVSWSPYGCQYFPPSSPKDLSAPKLDSLPKDPLAAGEQYYIDLGGNIRKGPLGVGNSCYCAPLAKDVEKQLESDRFALLDRIEAANLRLDEKIYELERLAKSHVNGISNDKVPPLKETQLKNVDSNSPSYKPYVLKERAEKLRQWAEYQLAVSSPSIYSHMYKAQRSPAMSKRSRDQLSVSQHMTRSWSEEAVSEYKEDCESGRFSSYKGLKVLDHPTSMYNITKGIHEDDDVLSEYRRPIASLVPGSWRCASPDACQSRITEDTRQGSPMFRRRETRRNSIDSSELLDDPYGPFKFKKEVKLLAIFPPQPDLVKESSDSGATTSEREHGNHRRSSTSIPSSSGSYNVNHKNRSRSNGNLRVYSPTHVKERSKSRTETGAIPKSNTMGDMSPSNALDNGNYETYHNNRYYSHTLQKNSRVVHGSQTTLVSGVSEYNYNRMDFKMHQKYDNITSPKGTSDGIYESYSSPVHAAEPVLDLDRKKMQQVAQKLYNGYFAQGHLEPVRRPSRPSISPYKERDSQNDSGYSARVSSSSSHEHPTTFSG